MREVEVKLNLPEGIFTAVALEYKHKKDRKQLYKIYKTWRKLSSELYKVSTRGANIPEGLTESAFCLEMNCIKPINIKKKSKQKVNTSFDVFDLVKKTRIQVKASSARKSPTSFGPLSEWDELYYLDFERDRSWDGKFDIYLINNKDIYSQNVNKTTSFGQQQKKEKRPRFSIYDKIIKPKGLLPILTGDLSV